MEQSNLDKKLQEMVQAAYANAPAVKTQFDELGLKPGDIQRVSDLVKLPVLPKDKIVGLQQAAPPFGGFLAVPLNQISHIFFSPGPIYEPGPESYDSAWEVAVSCLQQIGFEPGDIVLNSVSYHLVPAGFLVDGGLTRLGCTVIPGGTSSSDLQLQMMQDLNVTGYAGTPSFLMSLIKKAEEIGADFKKDFKLRKAFFSAEPLPPSLHQTFVETYGLAVGNAYATAEFGLLALNVAGGMAMRLMPEPIIELVDPETGQPVDAGGTGEVVVTNLSKIYPLLRVGTGDMAMNGDPNPGQSKQEERLITLVGRSGDAAKVRGMFVHPNQLRFAASQIAGVKAIQGVVTRPDLKDHFSLKIEVEPGMDIEAIGEQVKIAVRNLCRVRVDEVKAIPKGTITAETPGMIDERVWD